MIHNHDYFLEQFNNFCIKTRIREYCSDICNGSCCNVNNCQARLLNDFNECHKKLSCSSFLCYNLFGLLHSIDRDSAIKLDKLRSKLIDYLIKNTKSDTNIFDRNIYFNSYSMLNENISSTPFPDFSKSFYESIRKLMDEKIKHKISRYDLMMETT